MKKVFYKKPLQWKITFLLSVIILQTMLPGGVFATPVYDPDFYAANNIYIYKPDDNGCSATQGVFGINNKDYAGGSILNASQLGGIEGYQTIYEKSATKYNIPWQLLAVIHLYESNLKLYGPDNKNGPYQVPDGGSPVGDYSDVQFQDATDRAAAYLRNLAGDKDLTDGNVVKFVLFHFNNPSNLYVEQAKSLGFNDTEAANGEGSPYVMNRIDAKRDPTVTPTSVNNTWGTLSADGKTLQYSVGASYGTYVLYSSLTKTGCSGSLTAGGMDLEAAKAFMETYKSDPNATSFLGGAGQDCVGGPLANCVSFSVYFINKYTNLIGFASGAPGNGIDVAPNVVARNSGLQIGTQPRPYAIFSGPGSSSAGHTGVILGVDTTRQIVVVGEAGCGLALSWVTAREYPLSKFSDGTYKYAYTDGHLNNGVGG